MRKFTPLPRAPSYYTKHMDAVGNDRQVIYYDQLVYGKSDHITDTSIHGQVLPKVGTRR